MVSHLVIRSDGSSTNRRAPPTGKYAEVAQVRPQRSPGREYGAGANADGSPSFDVRLITPKKKNSTDALVPKPGGETVSAPKKNVSAMAGKVVDDCCTIPAPLR